MAKNDKSMTEKVKDKASKAASKVTTKLGMNIESLKEFYLDELRDVYDAEKQILSALETMKGKATHTELKSAFQDHIETTRMQKQRLEKMFTRMGKDPGGVTCIAMKGIIGEGQKVMTETTDNATRDAAMVLSAQKVEHYEMAAYGTLRTYAQRLGFTEDATMLQETLDEEEGFDERLTNLAVGNINVEAERSGTTKRV